MKHKTPLSTFHQAVWQHQFQNLLLGDDHILQYLVVYDEILKENITLHPSTMKERVIKDNIVIIPDTDRTVTKHIHAIQCQCKKCGSHFDKLLGMVFDTGAKVIDGKDMNAVNDVFEDLNKKGDK